MPRATVRVAATKVAEAASATAAAMVAWWATALATAGAT